ncbi:MAG: RNA polymerase sigma factor [Acidimicrobiia bacterium]
MDTPTQVGRRDQLAELYEAEAPRALKLAYLLTGDRALAEDLVHDAFVRVGGRLGGLRDPEAFGAYLRQTVVNLTRNQFRRNALARKFVENERALPQQVSETTDVETRNEVWEALQQLPLRQREALVCRFYLDLSERETANALKCPPGTVKSLTSRGLETLRNVLGVDES